MGNFFSETKVEVDEEYSNVDFSEASHPFEKKRRELMENASQNENMEKKDEVVFFNGRRNKRKRRKRLSNNPKTDEPIENNVPEFRKDIISLFTGSNLNRALRFYFTSVNKMDRSKTIDDEIMFCFEFHYMNAMQRINELAAFSEDHQNLILTHLLQQLSEEFLKNLFRTHFPNEEEVTGKSMIVQEIITRYFRRSGEYQNRVEEAKNISTIKNTNSFRFVRMADILIPQDIILQILSFLDYDSSLLYDVGSVCKSFYLTILSSWPSVKINKNNIYQVSLLVLNSVKSVRINVTEPSQNLQNYEVEHLLTNLNPSRLRTVEIESNLRFYLRALRYITTRSPMVPFPYVRTLRYSYSQGNSDKDQQAFSSASWGKLRVTEVFPNLREFVRPVHIYLLMFMRVKKVLIDLSIRKMFGLAGFVHSLSGNLGLVKSTVEELEVVLEYDDHAGISSLPELLIGYSDLKTLQITVKCETCKRRSIGVNFLSLQHLSSVTKIVLRNDMKCCHSGFRAFLFPILDQTDEEQAAFPNLQSLEISSKVEVHGISFDEARWCMSMSNLKNVKFTVFIQNEDQFETFLSDFTSGYQRFESLRLTMMITPRENFRVIPYPKGRISQKLSFCSKKGSRVIWIGLENSLGQYQSEGIRSHKFVKLLLKSLKNLLLLELNRRKWIVFYHHGLARNIRSTLSSANLEYIKKNQCVVDMLIKGEIREVGYALSRIENDRMFYYVCKEMVEEI